MTLILILTLILISTLILILILIFTSPARQARRISRASPGVIPELVSDRAR